MVRPLASIANVPAVAGIEIIHNGPVPPYRQIAAWLRGRIEAGEWVPEQDPLPSLKQLVQQTGVATTTVLRALDVLREAGLIYTVPARGTYVRRPG